MPLSPYRQLNKNNTSGYPGVHLHNRKRKWMAYLTINGKRRYLGSFRNLDDAIRCRKEAEAAHPRRPTLVQHDDPSIRLIPLTQGQVAIIDADDNERVAARLWCAYWDKVMQSFYARGPNGGLRMHRFILGLTNPAIQCDHRNGNTLDNRKANLRPATPAQNGHNRRTRRDNKSGHAGVGWHKASEQWSASIRTGEKRIHLGLFDNKEDAIRARQAAEFKYWGEWAARQEHQSPRKPPVSVRGAIYMSASSELVS